MPRQSKLDLAKIRASLFMLCPLCGHKIHPSERLWLDGERLKCPKCGVAFRSELSPNLAQ
jgi:predicted RNA-binding Zn-ribbon protein involved in translation (DUF1610 family)